MPLPKQAFVPPRDRLTHAPYNFVPLPEAVLTVSKEDQDQPKFDAYYSNKHTGVIDLTITTETLLYTRCAYPPERENEEVYLSPDRQQFFHHGNPAEPFLPGSSIRGMLLSLLEVITYSRMTRVHQNQRLVYRAVGDTSTLGEMYKEKFFGTNDNPISYPLTNVKGGYLKELNGEWMIQPAKDHGTGETFVHTVTYPAFANGLRQIIPVWLVPPTSRTQLPRKRHRPPIEIAQVDNHDPSKLSNSRTRPTTGTRWVRGTLVKSGHMPGKHRHCIIYEADPDPTKEISIEQELWELYKQDSNHTRGKLLNGGDPLFYLTDSAGKLVFFGPTQLFRIPYELSIEDMIPPSLNNPNDLDMAEAMFGSTKRKGRLRVLDAKLSSSPPDGQVFCAENNGRIIPRILSGPKPTSFQNYLVQPERDVPKNKLKHYDNPCNPGGNGTVIRGHKGYWNKPTNVNDVKELNEIARIQNGVPQFKNTENVWDAADSQHTVIKPVKQGCVFSGKIHFENLSNLELGALLTALTLENDQSRHRLGMGKPYGMGRIKIENSVHLYDRKIRYSSMDGFGEKLDEKAKQLPTTCRNEFAQCIINHHLRLCGGTVVTTIWNIPRLKDLALLMALQGPNGDHAPNYVPLGDNLWRHRHVLPTPLQAMGLMQPQVQNRPKGLDNPFNDIAVALAQVHVLPIPGGIAVGQKVTCIVSDKKTQKLKWKFQVKDGVQIGTLRSDSITPEDIGPGKEYLLTVVDIKNPANIIFKMD